MASHRKKVDIRTMHLTASPQHTPSTTTPTQELEPVTQGGHMTRELRTVAWCSIPLFIALIASSIADTKWNWVITLAERLIN